MRCTNSDFWNDRRIKDRGDLSPQTPQLRQNPGQHTLLTVNLTLLFVASHKNGSLAPLLPP